MDHEHLNAMPIQEKHQVSHVSKKHTNQLGRNKRNLEEVLCKQTSNSILNNLNNLNEDPDLTKFCGEAFKKKDLGYALRFTALISKHLCNITSLSVDDVYNANEDKANEIERIRNLLITKGRLQKLLEKIGETNKELRFYKNYIGETAEQRSIQEVILLDDLNESSKLLGQEFNNLLNTYNQLLYSQLQEYNKTQ
ncbi:hypothetical protein COBT_001542 [Conglomerata obtusa]